MEKALEDIEMEPLYNTESECKYEYDLCKESDKESNASSAESQEDSELCPFCEEPLPAEPSKKLTALKATLLAMPEFCKGLLVSHFVFNS